MANETHPTYTCTQQELYSKTLLGWANCKANRTDFFSKKSKYTVAFIDGKIAAINAAKALPDEGMRDLSGINLHDSLITLGGICLDNFQDLKLYIDDVQTYAHDTLRAHYTAAGANYFRKGSNNNWEQVEGLNAAMINFIADQNTALLANGNMPNTFQAKVAGDAGNFHTAYESFKTATDTGVSTDTKISANNAIDTDYKSMLKDGKGVFRNNATKLDLFIDEKILAVISPPGSASLGVTVILDDTSLPAGGAAITLSAFQKPDVTGAADDGGKKQFDGIDVARWSYSISFPNYVTATGVKEVDKGVGARLTVRLVKQ